MNAELCRLLARAQSSPYFRVEGGSVSSTMKTKRPLMDYITEEALKAYSLDKMPALLQGFLKDCDRSIEVEYELFQGKMVGTQAEMDAQVMQRMEAS